MSRLLQPGVVQRSVDVDRIERFVVGGFVESAAFQQQEGQPEAGHFARDRQSCRAATDDDQVKRRRFVIGYRFRFKVDISCHFSACRCLASAITLQREWCFGAVAAAGLPARADGRSQAGGRSGARQRRRACAPC
nr:hypothetical protein [Burkholderia stabilis]